VFGAATRTAPLPQSKLKSSSNDGLTIQVGANSGDALAINIDCASAEYLGVKASTSAIRNRLRRHRRR
jgi:hypothetical protein